MAANKSPQKEVANGPAAASSSSPHKSVPKTSNVSSAGKAASAAASVDDSTSSPKDTLTSNATENPTTNNNGALAAASIDVSSNTAENPTTSNDASVAPSLPVSSKNHEDLTTTDEAPMTAASDISSKATKSSTTANGSPVKQHISSSPKADKGKKRALPEPVDEQVSAAKKTKDSPQSSPSPSRAISGPSDAAIGTPDKENWQGFCEIENNEAYFSVILREIGVTNVTVRQVLMLDPDILATMPNPIVGLILCYRHRDFDIADQEKTNPRDIWFANQMPAQNSCATLAMIHTLMNTDSTDIDIGEHMRQFKEYSKDLAPFYRGQAFASWRFVKKIHNSFAKKMDIAKDDKYLAHKVRKSERKAALKLNSAPKSTVRRNSQDSNSSEESSEGNAQHYIAFVPRDGAVWKLDGMNKLPTRIGSYDAESGESWTAACSERINDLMTVGGDAEYSVFAIAQSPLVGLREEVVKTDNTIKAVDRRLDALNVDWRGFVPAEDVQPPSPSWLGCFTDEGREQFPVPAKVLGAIEGEGVEGLLERRGALVSEFRRLVTAWVSETDTVEQEKEAADRRRTDLGPVIKRWLEILAENGSLEELAEEFPAE
jgi:ubiquitin carboxyl-terminal hydrolase L5